MKRFPLILAVLALIIWVYFNNRQGNVEMYNLKKVELLGYISSDEFEPEKFKSMMSEMTDDADAILIAYTFAKIFDYDGLFKFVDNYFPE